jgi:hypothetical protein
MASEEWKLDPDFTLEEQAQFLESMQNSGVGERKEQIKLLGYMLTRRRDAGEQLRSQTLATEYQIDKERSHAVTEGRPAPVIRDKAPYAESGKKLLQKIPETLTSFYSDPLGAACPWGVTLKHPVTPQGRKKWVLSVTRKRSGVVAASVSASLISDELMNQIESSVPDGSEVWVFVSIDTLKWIEWPSHFTPPMRTTVAENASRGVSYSYFYAESRTHADKIDNLKLRFQGKKGSLQLYDIGLGAITILPCEFISFNPLDPSPTVYMRMPAGSAQKGWIALGEKAARMVIKVLSNEKNCTDGL